MNILMMMASAVLTWVFLICDAVAFIAFICTEDTGYSHDFNFTWWMFLSSLIYFTFMACVSWTCTRYLEQQVAKDNAENGEGGGNDRPRESVGDMGENEPVNTRAVDRPIYY